MKSENRNAYTVKSVYKLTAARKHANYSTQTRTFLHAKTQFCPRKHANTQHRKHANTQTRKHANTQKGYKIIGINIHHHSFTMPRLSLELRQAVIYLKDDGCSNAEILRILKIHGHSISPIIKNNENIP